MVEMVFELFSSAAYLFAGSVSTGYVLLRLGWPSTRGLNESYKIGWALVFGAGFAVVSLLLSFLLAGLGFSSALMASSGLLFIALVLFFSIKRKTVGKKKLRVSVPKEVFVNSASRQQRERLIIASRNLPENKTRELKMLLEKSDKIEGKPVQAAEKKQVLLPAEKKKMLALPVLNWVPVLRGVPMLKEKEKKKKEELRISAEKKTQEHESVEDLKKQETLNRIENAWKKLDKRKEETGKKTLPFEKKRFAGWQFPKAKAPVFEAEKTISVKKAEEIAPGRMRARQAAKEDSKKKVGRIEKLRIALFGGGAEKQKPEAREEELPVARQPEKKQVMEQKTKPVPASEDKSAEAFQRIVEKKELELKKTQKSLSDNAKSIRETLKESRFRKLEEREEQKKAGEDRENEIKKIMTSLKSISSEKKKKKAFVPRRLMRFERDKEEEEMIEDIGGISEQIPETSFSREEVDEESSDVFSQAGENRRAKELAFNEFEQFVSKHRRTPKGKEYDEIAENLYEQLKGETEKGTGRSRRAHEVKVDTASGIGMSRREKLKKLREEKGKDEKSAEAGEEIDETEAGEAIGGMNVKDLFKEEEGSGKEEAEEVSDITDISDEFELKGLEDGIDNISEEFETSKNTCPNCRNKTNELIFCFECGTGFCPHCAAKAKKIGDVTHYTCPKCGAEVKLRPKA